MLLITSPLHMCCAGAVRDRRRWWDLKNSRTRPDGNNILQAADRSQALDRLVSMIQRLKPLDRHVILSYLEGHDAAAISEITGLSLGNVAVKIHRIKNLLACQFQQGERR